MANAPFSGEFESLARQYWNTWNELLGGRSSGALDGWGLLGGLPPGLGRIDPGAYDWYQRMQRLAADFSGGGRAADIASAWRDMMGGQAHAAEPFAGMLRSMHGGLAGGDWLEQMRPLLDMMLRPLREQRADWLQRPAFGPAREHQERLQALALAWQQWEERNEAFNAILAQAGQGAFERFERLLEQHDAPGKRLESARALFDLWIDAAEAAWVEIAMSAEYRHAYAEMTNALMRLRLGLQREVEQFGTLLGLPGRSELDALHRKVADLERSLHAARRGAAKPAAARPAPAPASRPVRPVAASVDPERLEAKAPAVPARSPVTAKAAARSTARKRTPVAGGGAAGAAAKAAKKTHARTTRPAAAGAARGTGAAKATPAAARTRAAAAKAPAAKAVVARPATAKAAIAKPPAAVRPKPAKAARAAESAAASRKPATPRRAPAKAAAKRVPQASTATARKARVVKAANAAAHRAPARAAAAPAPAPAPAKVVSMKDWVSRNLDSARPDAPGRKARK